METRKKIKNRILVNDYDCDETVSRMAWSYAFKLKHMYNYKSKEINQLSLNITNSLDLIEKLKSLLCSTTSHLEKFKSVNNPPHDTLEIIAKFTTPTNSGELFKIKFELKHENIFHKINLCIENEIKKIF